jgi:hypothetical protein
LARWRWTISVLRFGFPTTAKGCAMADNRCPSRLTTESLDFSGPMTFQCSLGAGHFPMTPHTWALVWTDLGADPVEAELFKEPGTLMEAYDRCDPKRGHHSTPHRGCILR